MVQTGNDFISYTIKQSLQGTQKNEVKEASRLLSIKRYRGLGGVWGVAREVVAVLSYG